MAPRDARHHPYFAGNGYAAVRADLRGTGELDGILLDEYCAGNRTTPSKSSLWLAAQPWCTGEVGMFGSPGAGSTPCRSLRAGRLLSTPMITVARRTTATPMTSITWAAGSALDMLAWAATMLALLARPPDPALVGDGWRETWFARWSAPPFGHLASPPATRRLLAPRLGLRGLRARSRRVCAIGGWADGYTDAILRLLARLPGPRRA